jgi:hypothetical protein
MLEKYCRVKTLFKKNPTPIVEVVVILVEEDVETAIELIQIMEYY